jgi:lipoate-protein ligase A
MHGEFKTPGGKLVVVDFDVQDGRLTNVMISGDFFLYPEDALPALSGALEGVDRMLGGDALAERIRLGFPPGAELLGTSPEAIATAVERGLVDSEEQGRT